jgi:hypothetical protein
MPLQACYFSHMRPSGLVWKFDFSGPINASVTKFERQGLDPRQNGMDRSHLLLSQVDEAMLLKT